MIRDLINKKENVLLVVNLEDLKELVNQIHDERDAELKAIADNQHENELLTADETAKLLGVKKNSLWRWAKNGYLTPVKIGRKCLYRQKDIEKLCQNEK